MDGTPDGLAPAIESRQVEGLTPAEQQRVAVAGARLAITCARRGITHIGLSDGRVEVRFADGSTAPIQHDIPAALLGPVVAFAATALRWRRQKVEREGQPVGPVGSVHIPW